PLAGKPPNHPIIGGQMDSRPVEDTGIIIGVASEAAGAEQEDLPAVEGLQKRLHLRPASAFIGPKADVNRTVRQICPFRPAKIPAIVFSQRPADFLRQQAGVAGAAGKDKIIRHDFFAPFSRKGRFRPVGPMVFSISYYRILYALS